MFEKMYPYLSAWINTIGWAEFGEDDMSQSLLRILNHGGMIWEDEEAESIEEALQNAEEYLKNDLENEYGIELEI